MSENNEEEKNVCVRRVILIYFNLSLQFQNVQHNIISRGRYYRRILLLLLCK